jgi:hypothetical protein
MVQKWDLEINALPVLLVALTYATTVGQAAQFQRGIPIEASGLAEKVLNADVDGLQLDFVVEPLKVGNLAPRPKDSR